MSRSLQVYPADERRHPLFWPFLISIVGHLLLVVVIVINPAWQADDDTYLLPGAITVQMVGPPAAGGSSPEPGPAAAPESKAPPKPEPKPQPKPEPQPVPEKAEIPEPPEPVVVPKTEVQPEISIAPKPIKPKTALKYKTVKSKEELQKALKQLEQKVEERAEQQAEQANTQQLQDTLQRLKNQVAKQERAGSGAAGGGGAGTPGAKPGSAAGGAGEGQTGGFGQGGKEEPELIDLYRLEVAFQIQKNWAYAGGGDNLVAMVVFKVMPDGTIPEKEIFFTDRSGNATLDDSAYRAIVKSSPTKPHPPAIRKPYVEIGLRFTPKGVQ